MNPIDLLNSLGKSIDVLNDKKQQTTKKIEYVREYVAIWARISAMRSDINTINFIDCMCNAGIYLDGDYCSAIEVLKIFIDLSYKYPQKNFRLLCNDINSEKIQVLNEIVKRIIPDNCKNVYIDTNCDDVNIYLTEINKNPHINGCAIFGYGASTILYVDPYDFGTVIISNVSDILKKHYCELLFNFFISDFRRNIKTDKGRIRKCLNEEDITTVQELISYIETQLRVGYIKFLFSYQFKTTTNIEMYQILFATPNLRGLEKLKEALWKVFNGAEFHRNKVEDGQMSLFTPEDEKVDAIITYSREAIVLLSKNYASQQLSYQEIETIIIENTMLNKSHIINNVLKPMISENSIEKCGLVSKSSNYTKDMYLVKNEVIF